MLHPDGGKLEPVELGPVRVAGRRKSGDGSLGRCSTRSPSSWRRDAHEDDKMFAGDILKFHKASTVDRSRKRE